MDHHAYGFGSVGGRRGGGPGLGPPAGRRGRRPGPGSAYLPSPFGTPPLSRQTWGLGLSGGSGSLRAPPPAASTCSGSSSWLLWREAAPGAKPRARRRGRLCSALLAGAVLLVVLAVLAVASLAVYMGALRIDAGREARAGLLLLLDGRLRALGDERFEAALADNATAAFRRTAARYAAMVREAVAASPALGPALLRVDVHRFAAGSLLVFFRLTLDRRKVGVPAGGAGAGQVEEAAALAAEEALRREATAARPRAFRRVPLDPAAIFVGRVPVEDGSLQAGEDATAGDGSSLELRNGVLRKTAPRPGSAQGGSAPAAAPAPAPAPAPEPAGSFTVTKSEGSLTERRGGTRKEGRPRKPPVPTTTTTTTTTASTSTTPTSTTTHAAPGQPEPPAEELRPPPPPPPPPAPAPPPPEDSATTGAAFYGAGGASDPASLRTSTYFERYPPPLIPSPPPPDESPWRPILPSAGAAGEAEVVPVDGDGDGDMPLLPPAPIDTPRLPLLQHFPRLSLQPQEAFPSPEAAGEGAGAAVPVVEEEEQPPPTSTPSLVTLLPARSYLGGPLRRRPPAVISTAIQVKAAAAPTASPASPATPSEPPPALGTDHDATDTTHDSTGTDETNAQTTVPPTGTTLVDELTTEPTPENDLMARETEKSPDTDETRETEEQTPGTEASTNLLLEDSTTVTPPTDAPTRLSEDWTTNTETTEETFADENLSDEPVTTERTWQSVPLVTAGRRRQPKMAIPASPQDVGSDDSANAVPGVEVSVNFSVSRVSAARGDQAKGAGGAEEGDEELAEHLRVLSAVSKLANVQSANSPARPPVRGESKAKVNATTRPQPSPSKGEDTKYTKVNTVTHHITEYVPLSSSADPVASAASPAGAEQGAAAASEPAPATAPPPPPPPPSPRPTLPKPPKRNATVTQGSADAASGGSGGGVPLFPLLTKIYHKVDPATLARPSADEQRAQAAHNSTGCPPERSFRCGDGECLSPRSRCNQLVDCADGADERGCACADYLRAQYLTRKLCDGVVDCWDYSDENQCEWCSPGQFVCPNSQVCVSPARLCDGARDCPYGDDERQCVTVSETADAAGDFPYHSEGYLMVRQSGQWGKLCLHNFEKMVANSRASWQVSDLGRAVCKAMTYSDFDRVDRATDEPASGRDGDGDSGSGDLYFELAIADSPGNASDGPSPRSSLEFRPSLCPQRDVVRVSCRDLECGVRPQAVHQWARSRGSRIVGGGNAGPGAWPWQAALYKEGEFQCGATLISSRWLVSAGHCFYHSQDDYWVARLGALRRGTALPSPYEQQRPIARVLLHPGYVDAGFVNDISLLRMREPVAFSDYVRPICLPPAGTELRDGRLCTVVGWGQLFEVGRIFPDTLQEVALPVISTAECRKRTLFLPLYRVTDNMFCAGYDRGGRDACLGDSGGPLMCQEPDGRWALQGVTSNGYGCARANRPGVYTKVANYVPWIRAALAGEAGAGPGRADTCRGHRCPLGECLPPSRVCNGFMECSDGSDERGCWGRGAP